MFHPARMLSALDRSCPTDRSARISKDLSAQAAELPDNAETCMTLAAFPKKPQKMRAAPHADSSNHGAPSTSSRRRHCGYKPRHADTFCDTHPFVCTPIAGRPCAGIAKACGAIARTGGGTVRRCDCLLSTSTSPSSRPLLPRRGRARFNQLLLGIKSDRRSQKPNWRRRRIRDHRLNVLHVLRAFTVFSGKFYTVTH